MIQGLRADITVVIVAHRLTTVEQCNYVYWLKDGKLHSNGTPAEMLEQYNNFLKSSESKKSH